MIVLKYIVLIAVVGLTLWLLYDFIKTIVTKINARKNKKAKKDKVDKTE